MLNKKVGAYIRVSTEEQTENYSIDEQTTRLKAFCTAKGWSIYKCYTDGGYTGSNIKRPALNQLIDDINNKKINLVLVYKLDRLSRSQKDTLYLIEDIFLKNNIEFVSINENLDTSSPYGRAMIGILSAFAQLEREQITERMTMGRTARAKEGKFHGGAYAPIGYDYIDGKLILNTYEAEQVKIIFDMYIKGYSIHSIQKYMNEKYNNKYSSWHNHTSIYNCLRNRIYTGKIKFSGQYYTGTHTPIISDKIFELANNNLSNNDYKKTSSQKRPFKATKLLSSMLICGNCGAGFFSDHGKYTCYSRGKSSKKFIKNPDCKMKKWNIEQLDLIIKDEIKKLYFTENYIDDTYNKSNKNNNLNLENIKKRIHEIDKQINRMIDLYQIGNIPIDKISEKINALQNEKDTLNLSIKEQPKKLTLKEVKNKKKIISILDNGNLEEQRALLKSLIDRIIVYEDSVKIFWSFE